MNALRRFLWDDQRVEPICTIELPIDEAAQERMRARAEELKQQMGERYLLHESNRVVRIQRTDGGGT